MLLCAAEAAAFVGVVVVTIGVGSFFAADINIGCIDTARQQGFCLTN